LLKDTAMADASDRVLSFLRKTIDQDLDLDTPLIDSGLLDSFHVVELLTFVENELGVRLNPSDVTHDDLRNARSVAALLDRLRPLP
jgi:acyl carrier protein